MIWDFASRATQSKPARYSGWILIGSLLFSTAVLAQEPAPQPTSAEEAVASAAADDVARADAQPPASDDPAPVSAGDDYTPTESISEDLSVSFPVDI